MTQKSTEKGSKAKSKKKTRYEVLKSRSVNLPCELSTKELAERSDALANVVREEEELATSAKAVKARLSEQAKELINERTKLANIVRSKNEYRDVKVEDVADYTEGLVRTIRKDTGVTVDSRPIQDYERQMRMLVDSTPSGGPDASGLPTEKPEDQKQAQQSAMDLVGELALKFKLSDLPEEKVKGLVADVKGKRGKLTSDEKKKVKAAVEAHAKNQGESKEAVTNADAENEPDDDGHDKNPDSPEAAKD